MFELDVEIKGSGTCTISKELILKRLALIDADCEEAEYLNNLLKRFETE